MQNGRISFSLSAPDPLTGKRAPLASRALGALLAGASLALFFTLAFLMFDYEWNWAGIWEYRAKFWLGWWMTIALSAGSMVLALLLGLVLALGSQVRFLPVYYLCKFYVELIRGTPLLVQIMVFFYVVANLLQVQNRYLAGIVILAMFSGAYIAEILRAGIEGVGRSQRESALAIGLTRWQTYRHVIFPQATRSALPPLTGQFVSLIKDSSLLSIIAISEFTLNAREVSSITFSTLESFLPLAAGYLVLTIPVSVWTRRMEKRLHFDT